MMTTTLGEDYLHMAEAKGLKPGTIFGAYALRNALLPQVTSLAISLAMVMSGAVLVEVIFGYPGVGNLLFKAIADNDYFVIQGIVALHHPLDRRRAAGARSALSAHRPAHQISARLGDAMASNVMQPTWWQATWSRNGTVFDCVGPPPPAGRGRHPGARWSRSLALSAACSCREEMSEVGAGRPAKPPSAEHWLGTDQQGRDVLADLIYGTPTSLEIGLIAGVIGVTLGALMGLIAGYAGGIVDEVIRVVVDILLTIPSLMILIIVASMLGAVTVEAMALIIAALAWMWPARTVRAQVLTIRERMYVQVAKFNGASDLKIIIGELLPNLLPYLAANLVGAVSGAILASVGLSTLGLGPMTRPSLGLTFYWAITYGALHPRDVVVVHAAHRDHRHPLPGALPDEPGPGPHREPQAPEQSDDAVPVTCRQPAPSQGWQFGTSTEVRIELEHPSGARPSSALSHPPGRGAGGQRRLL